MEKDTLNERIKIDTDLWELEKRQLAIKRYESVLRVYSIFGIIIAIFGISYFVLTLFSIKLTESQQISLIISGVGIILSITSWLLLIMRRAQRKDEIERLKDMQSITEFLWKWTMFEQISKVMLQNYKVEFNRFSIREIIYLLMKEGKIDHSDELALEEAIQARNMVVHGGKLLPKDLILHYSKRIDEIVNKINKSERL